MTDEIKGNSGAEYALTPDGKLVIDGEAFDMEPDEVTGEQPETDSREDTPYETPGAAQETPDIPEDVPEETGTEEPEDQPQYTPEEIREIGLEKLDPKRLPPELLPYYKSLQGDYTRKTQQLADERRILEAAKKREEPASPETKEIGKPSEETPGESPFKVIVEAAKNLACAQYLGIPPEDFDEFNIEHATALQTAMRRLEYEASRKAETEQRIAQQARDFGTLCASYRETLPEFDDIANTYFAQWMEGKPYKDYNRIIGIFKNGSIPEIKTVIDEVISDWRNAKGGKPRNIPAVESARGTSLVGSPGKGGSNARSLGEMTADEQAEWLVKNRLV